MGAISYLTDRLTNALTGTGTSRDPRLSNAYAARILTQHEISAAYSGSGLMRKIVQIPALDMVREWRTWTGAEADQIAKLYEAEKRFNIVGKIKQAETLRGMGGGALILGLPGNTDQPAPEKAPLAYVHVVSRWHLTFDRLNTNALTAGYGEPEMWMLTTDGGQQSIHPSRVVPFRADNTASLTMVASSEADQFWGESTVQQVLDAVQDSDLARQSFAALIHKARLLRIGIPNLLDIASTSDGEAQVMKRLAILATAESIHNATIYDAGDSEDGKGGEKITDAEYTFAGVKDVLNSYGEWVAAISDIPATRLLGRAPEGMNSSGDSQQKDWNKKIRALQTLDLAPCLDRLDRHLVPAAIGSRPDTLAYDFDPLDTPSEKERAEVFKIEMEAAEKLQQTASVPDEAFNRGLQSLLIERGYLPELEHALADIPDDERYGIAKGGDPISLGGGADVPDADADPASLVDAAARTLYVSRPVLNRADLQKWATAQGLGDLQDDLHVTLAYSTRHLDWMKVDSEDWNQEKDGGLSIAPGGVRIVEPLGDRTAVLLFGSSRLAWRHEQIKNAGASWDFPDYQPHISLTGEPVDLDGVEPYQGKIELGPERFEEVS